VNKDARKSRYSGAPTPSESQAFGELLALAAAAMAGEPPGATYLAQGVSWPEPRPRSFAAYIELHDALTMFDARRQLRPRYEVPMFFVQGADDLYSVTAEVQRYAAEIDAPHVELVTIDGAGHSVMFVRDAFLAALERHVRPWLKAEIARKASVAHDGGAH
jgi:pimeloyl-ACP methyl ester carboxylesterase